MEMFKEMLVLLILITSVINQCLLPVKTGNWSLVIPVILRYIDRNGSYDEDYGSYPIGTKEIHHIVWNHLYVRGRGEVIDYREDFNRLDHKLSQCLRDILPLNPFPFINVNYAAVMKHGTFKHGYFLDNQTGHYYAWDTSLEYFSTYYNAEAKESVLSGSTTQFITFNIRNGVNFSLQLVERKDDLWTTNEPFLFLSNRSRRFSNDQNIVLFNIFLKKAQPLFCDPVINIGSANTFENITIVVVILITITIAVIVSAYVLKRKCSRKQKQYIRKFSLVYKKRTNENTASGYEVAVEVNEYAEIGNTNRIFYDLLGNRVNEILGEEQQEYDYAYSTIKPWKSLGAEENSEFVNNENTESGYENAVEVHEYKYE